MGIYVEREIRRPIEELWRVTQDPAEHVLRSGDQRFYERFVGFRFPMSFSGRANVCEWYDDESEEYRIEVKVSNNRWGKLFGYRGSFDVEWRKVDIDGPPADLKPVREEQRE